MKTKMDDGTLDVLLTGCKTPEAVIGPLSRGAGRQSIFTLAFCTSRA